MRRRAMGCLGFIVDWVGLVVALAIQSFLLNYFFCFSSRRIWWCSTSSCRLQ
jgi:hypothetical protein